MEASARPRSAHPPRVPICTWRALTKCLEALRRRGLPARLTRGTLESSYGFGLSTATQLQQSFGALGLTQRGVPNRFMFERLLRGDEGITSVFAREWPGLCKAVTDGDPVHEFDRALASLELSDSTSRRFRALVLNAMAATGYDISLYRRRGREAGHDEPVEVMVRTTRHAIDSAPHSTVIELAVDENRSLVAAAERAIDRGDVDTASAVWERLTALRLEIVSYERSGSTVPT